MRDWILDRLLPLIPAMLLFTAGLIGALAGATPVYMEFGRGIPPCHSDDGSGPRPCIWADGTGTPFRVELDGTVTLLPTA